MFELLFESRPVRRRRVGHSLLSFALHGGLIGGAVAVTHRTPASSPPPIDVIDVSFPIATAEPTTTASSTSTPEGVIGGPQPLSRRFLSGADDPSPVDPLDLPPAGPMQDIRDLRRQLGSELPTRGILELGSGLSASDLPDSPPALLNPVVPVYPEALRAAGMPGRVTLEFIVDSTGRALAESVIIRASDHPTFSMSAERAILASRYRPARREGRACAARVQQVVVFAVR